MTVILPPPHTKRLRTPKQHAFFNTTNCVNSIRYLCFTHVYTLLYMYLLHVAILACSAHALNYKREANLNVSVRDAAISMSYVHRLLMKLTLGRATPLGDGKGPYPQQCS